MTQMNAIIQNKIDRMVASGKYAGVTVNAYRQSDDQFFRASAGNLTDRQAYFGMGTTYLYVTTILMQLVEEGRLALDTPFVAYIKNSKWTKELHVKDGVDYTASITIRHLMRHTTGLADSRYFKTNFKRLSKALMNGEDSQFTFEETLKRARSYGARSLPGEFRRPTFSDTHFHILGKVIEYIDGKPLADVLLDRIAKPLGLKSTYVYCDPADCRPASLQSTKGPIKISRLMTSFQAESGIVTTSHEAMIFARAFFEGYLFDKRYFRDIADLAPLMSVMQYGAGYGAIKLPYVASIVGRLKTPARLLMQNSEMHGHMGKNGSFIFMCPKERIYVTGTTNFMGDMKQGASLASQVIDVVANEPIRKSVSEAVFSTVDRDDTRDRAVATMRNKPIEAATKASLRAPS